MICKERHVIPRMICKERHVIPRMICKVRHVILPRALYNRSSEERCDGLDSARLGTNTENEQRRSLILLGEQHERS